MMGNEIAAMSRQVEVLQHENASLKARERHISATSGRGMAGGRGMVGGASLDAERKKIDELERTLEALQTDKAVS